jgi:molybdate transport system permease protein
VSGASQELSAVWLTAALAGITTAILLLVGAPLAWWIARGRSWWRHPVEAVTSLPLVLPPTVLGFYLLLALGPRGLAFTFPGLVIGSVVYSLPFVIQPLRASFAAVDMRALEAAATLRASPRDRFLSVALPLARRGVLSAAVLGFAHTVGEFGVVLMIGGGIPGRTKVLSVAIYDHVEALEYGQAHALAGGLVLFSFVVLLLLHLLNRRRPGGLS